MVKIVSVFFTRLTLEEKPITARFTVYSPVSVMMPARIEGIENLVCSAAVMKPAAAPDSMAAGKARKGCPRRANVAATAAPRVKAPLVVISAMFRMRKLRNSASATRA